MINIIITTKQHNALMDAYISDIVQPQHVVIIHDSMAGFTTNLKTTTLVQCDLIADENIIMISSHAISSGHKHIIIGDSPTDMTTCGDGRVQHTMQNTINYDNVSYPRPDMSNNMAESAYLAIMHKLLTTGEPRQSRNGPVLSLFGEVLHFDISTQFPLLTTKLVFFRGVCEELFFFLRGDTDTNRLSAKGVKIWEPNTTKEFISSRGLSYDAGDMGPMYGFNLVHYGEKYINSSHQYAGINQLAQCIHLLKTDPFSRRIIATTFNPSNADEGVLYPCHGISIQFFVSNEHALSCQVTQRSADIICGVPFNIASYALLVYIFVEVINNDTTYVGPRFKPGKLMMCFGDIHIYTTHIPQAQRQTLRAPKPFPTLKFDRKITDITQITTGDVCIIGYKHCGRIAADMVA